MSGECRCVLYTDPSREVTAAVARALGETRSEGDYLGMPRSGGRRVDPTLPWERRSIGGGGSRRRSDRETPPATAERPSRRMKRTRAPQPPVRPVRGTRKGSWDNTTPLGTRGACCDTADPGTSVDPAHSAVSQSTTGPQPVVERPNTHQPAGPSRRIGNHEGRKRWSAHEEVHISTASPAVRLAARTGDASATPPSAAAVT
jgi:hypothetical protein